MKIGIVGKGQSIVHLINATGKEADVVLVAMPNEYVVGEDGCWEVPYADVPYELLNTKGIQRLNKDVADNMVNLFNTWRAKVARQFGGHPVFVGHPDVEYFANKGDTDKKAYGWIKGMEAREDCLALTVDLTDPGLELLANKSYKWFSPYFLGKCVGMENGKKIFEPVWIKSAGFTNNPRWPVAALVNEATITAAPEGDNNMDLLQRLVALMGLGKDGAEDATEDGVISAVYKLLEAAKKMKEEIEARWDAQDAAFDAVPNSAGFDEQGALLLTVLDGKLETLANEKTTLQTQHDEITAARDELQTSFTTERGERIELLVNQAVTDGRVTIADKPSWVEKLVAAEGDVFGTECEALVNAGTTLKIDVITKDLGKRESSAAITRDKVVGMVNSRMEKDHCDYTVAFNLVKDENPALFGENDKG